jgi:hypothetical protein
LNYLIERQKYGLWTVLEKRSGRKAKYLWWRLDAGWDICAALNKPARARQDKQFMGHKNA